MPKVSVVITTRNRADFLRAAIHSVEHQTFQDFELIVVDDASEDETSEVVRSFSDPRIRYFRHETNKGEGATRNTGVRHAAGEYIAFLDDDDEWLPRKLEKQVPLLDGSGSNVALVYSGFWKVEGTSKEIVARVVPQKRGAVFRDMWFQNWIGTPSTVMLRRACFEKVGTFDEGLAFGADYDMWLRVAKEFEVECLTEPLVLYTVHANRMSAGFESLIRGKEEQLRKYRHLFARDSKIYSRRYLSLGVLYCYNNEMAKARAALRRAIQLNPLEPRSYFNFGLSFLGAKVFTKIKGYRQKVFPLASLPSS